MDNHRDKGLFGEEDTHMEIKFNLTLKVLITTM